MAEIPTIQVALYAQTDVGMVRQGNEDNFLVLDLSTGTSWSAGEEEPADLLQFQLGYYGCILAVSDGMGGALAGEVASRLAVETVRDRMLQLQAHGNYGANVPFHERLRLAVEEANGLIHADGLSNPMHKGLGATFTGVGISGNMAYFAQVGDSRAHLIRQGKIARITKDQSLVQQLIDAGQITEEEAETHSYRNVILQALGAQNLVNVEVNALTLHERDILVLCSDGLSGKVSTHEIAEIVNHAGDFQTACQTLIALANQRGGEDNITVVIAQFFGEGLEQSRSDAIEPVGIARSPDTTTEINWAQGGDTDQLEAFTNQEAGVPNAPAFATSGSTGSLRSKATTPLTATPIPPPPATTTPLKQRTESLERTEDLTARRGPITAVYDVSQFQEALNSAPLPEPDPEMVSLRQAQADLLAQTTPSLTGDETIRTDPVGRASRGGYALPITLVLLLLAGLSTGIFWYFNQQAKETEARKQA
ncbi:MAG: serine/threonine-protein phosphatase, partial [Acidobacteria bacterium]|nr:serine/threonine-protein phosphatase [Acidobacteriota bacterium]